MNVLILMVVLEDWIMFLLLLVVDVLIFFDVLSVNGFSLLILELGFLGKFDREDNEFVDGFLLEFILDSYVFKISFIDLNIEDRL